MQSIFEKETRDEVINRINSLTADSKPLWGGNDGSTNGKTLFAL
jgi:hypothetical protein